MRDSGNRRAVYRGKAGLARSGRRGSRLDTIVAWTLTLADAGTRVTMLHSGFQLPENQVAYDAMRPGWGRAMRRRSASRSKRAAVSQIARVLPNAAAPGEATESSAAAERRGFEAAARSRRRQDRPSRHGGLAQ